MIARRLAPIICSLMIVGALAACGSKTDSGAQSSSGGGATSEPAGAVGASTEVSVPRPKTNAAETNAAETNAAETSAAESDTSKQPSSPIPTVPSSPALTAAVDEAVAFVESARQVSFRSRPSVIVLADGPFKRRLQELQDSDPQSQRDLERTDATLHAFGLLKSGTQAKGLLDALLGSGVLGFYDPKTDEMTIRGTKPSPLLRTILVHELNHALDDQLFELDRPELDKATDGSGEAFQYFVEGTARWVENSYRDSLSERDKKALEAEEMKASLDPSLFKVLADPNQSTAALFLIVDLLNPYELGKNMVGSLVDEKGPKAIGDVYARLPTNVEQASIYEKYRNAEPEVRVPTPPFTGTKILEGQLGMGSLNTYLGLGEIPTGSVELTDAAKGWAGDRFVVYKDAGKRCVRVDIAMDTPKDRDQLRAALAGPADAVNASVSTLGEITRLESCESA